ncbi:MAG: hypothetical protein C4320_00885, partial [Armatimonadota bacterium]
MIRPLLRRSRHLRGQTLIIALLILGVLLILSAVFTGILSRAISGASVASGRASISEFSEAGIRYAHKQLLTSELGRETRPPSARVTSPAIRTFTTFGLLPRTKRAMSPTSTRIPGRRTEEARTDLALTSASTSRMVAPSFACATLPATQR